MTTAGQVDFSRLPRHIAIIMDGNGRWAQAPGAAPHRGPQGGGGDLPPHCHLLQGHRREVSDGVRLLHGELEAVRRTEVSAIMDLLKRYLLEAVDTMERDHIRLHFFGDMTASSPRSCRPCARETDEITEHLFCR